MLKGKQTWIYNTPPAILSTGVVGGPFEAKGNIVNDFDLLHDDVWMNQNTFEKAQQQMTEEACQVAVKKMNLEKEQIDFFISGDLINQMTPTTFAASSMGVPYLGFFSACATSMEALAIAAMIIDSNRANYILSGCTSHHAATERQYRYPNEYGGQKPPTAQWTVTGAGMALVGKRNKGPFITAATIGKVVDYGMTDPFNMGGAMAPAAVETIVRHLKEREISIDYYDLIVTGDLGKIGRSNALDLLHEKGIHIQDDQLVDCGLTIYSEDQPVHAGASGAACAPIGMYGHYLKRMINGEFNRMLFVATGALHSPLTIQQNQAIPCIAHAVSIEMGSDLT